MAYNEKLANRIREYLLSGDDIEEKKMMGGLVFMVHGKMFVGVTKDELMCRVDPAKLSTLLEMHGCRQMAFTNRTLKGYVVIEESGIRSMDDFSFWMEAALAYNKKIRE